MAPLACGAMGRTRRFDWHGFRLTCLSKFERYRKKRAGALRIILHYCFRLALFL